MGIHETLAYHLFVEASCTTILGFGLFVAAMHVRETAAKIFFFLLGVGFVATAIRWNLTGGRIADAVRLYPQWEWQVAAIAWPIFLWIALFCLFRPKWS